MLNYYCLILGSIWDGQRGELPAAELGQHAEGHLQRRAVRRRLLQNVWRNNAVKN
jgi:hypothetical protein